MICAKCGHQWTLLRAHVIKVKRTPAGWSEIIQCPACGHEQAVQKPDMDCCAED